MLLSKTDQLCSDFGIDVGATEDHRTAAKFDVALLRLFDRRAVRSVCDVNGNCDIGIEWTLRRSSRLEGRFPLERWTRYDSRQA